MAYGKTEVLNIGQSGGENIRVYDVSPDAATGNIIIADCTAVKVLGIVGLIEDPAANAQVIVQAKENSVTLNQIDFKLWQSSNLAAVTNFKDFRIMVKTIR